MWRGFWLFIGFVWAGLLPAGVRGAATVGHVEGWGQDSFGQARPPAGLNDVVAIAAGQSHSLALRANGRVVGWGYNGEGQATVPAGLSNVVAIAARLHSLALRADGSVAAWGWPGAATMTVPPSATNVVAIAAGGGGNGNAFSLALRADGTIVAWGELGGGGTPPAGLGNVARISAGSYHALALKNDGTVVGWGGPNSGNPEIPPPGLAGVIAVRAGQTTSFVIKSDGTLFKWGGSFDSNDVPAGVSGVVDVSLGNQHVLALRTNGTVLAWGYNANGQGSVPAGISGVLAIAAGGNHNLVLTARPIIESISAPVAGTLGGAVTFNVTASGAPLGYQWKHRGTDLPGETNASLTINPVEVGNGGEYSVVVTNPHGSATASTAIIFPPPGITAQPQDLTVLRGERVSFNVGASGLGPFAYQWFRNGSAISNATSSAYEAVVLEAGDSGIFTVVVTDAAGGRTTSREARLTVVDPRVQMAAVRPALDTSISSGGANPRGAATILAGGRGNGTRDRGLLRFDLTAIPTNATVRGALLKLTVVMSPPGPAASTFYLHRALKNWDAAATWQNAIAGTLWSAPGGGENVDYEAAGAPGVVEPGGVVHAFAFTNETAAVFGDWIHEPAANHGWMLISDRESAGKTARHFGSSESAKPPELTVYYSEPPRPAVLRDVSIQTNRLVFQLTGEPGWLYEIQTRAEVNSGAWISLTNRPAGAALEPVVFEAPLSGARQFFRVLVN